MLEVKSAALSCPVTLVWSLSSSNIYPGIALRSEEIMKSEYAGHINYYSQEGTRLATGKLAYTIDETGEIAEQLNSGEANDELFTKDDYAKMQSEIASFTAKFRPGSFRQVYDFKNALSSELVKVIYTTRKMLALSEHIFRQFLEYKLPL